MTMQFTLEELPSAMFMFFFGALGYFSVYLMKHGMPCRTQRCLLQKKIVDFEPEHAQTESDSVLPQVEDFPTMKVVKKGRKRQKARVKVAAQSVPDTYAVETTSITGPEIKMKSESDAGSREVAGDKAELLPSYFDQLATGEHMVRTSDDVSCMGKDDACENGGMNNGKRIKDTDNIGDSLQETGGCCQFNQQPVEWYHGSEHGWKLCDEERRQLLGEWPETESEENCSDLDIDGMCDTTSEDSGKQAPFDEHRQSLSDWNNSSNSSSVQSRRWCKNPDQDDSAYALGWFSDQKWYGSRGQPHRDERDVQDEWMVPFDELLKGPSHVATVRAHEMPLLQPAQPSPAPAAGTPHGPVYIWNARHDGSGTAGGAGHRQLGEEMFTDGQQVFQPVPSPTGQSLFTDGQQLYAPVCVMLSPPSPAFVPDSQPPVFGFVPDSNYEDSKYLR